MAKSDKRLAPIRAALDAHDYDRARALILALPPTALRTAEADCLGDAIWRLSGESP